MNRERFLAVGGIVALTVCAALGIAAIWVAPGNDTADSLGLTAFIFFFYCLFAVGVVAIVEGW